MTASGVVTETSWRSESRWRAISLASWTSSACVRAAGWMQGSVGDEDSGYQGEYQVQGERQEDQAGFFGPAHGIWMWYE